MEYYNLGIRIKPCDIFKTLRNTYYYCKNTRKRKTNEKQGQPLRDYVNVNFCVILVSKYILNAINYKSLRII